MDSEIVRRLTRAGLEPPNTVTLAITNRCNLSCRHCCPGSGPDENAPVVPTTQVLRLIDDVVALGTEKLVITGGEPLTHPDWFNILTHACTRPGIDEVRLQTNAILITAAHVDAFLPLMDREITAARL